MKKPPGMGGGSLESQQRWQRFARALAGTLLLCRNGLLRYALCAVASAVHFADSDNFHDVGAATHAL